MPFAEFIDNEIRIFYSQEIVKSSNKVHIIRFSNNKQYDIIIEYRGERESNDMF